MNHKQYTRVYAPVDLDAIVFNMESMRQNIDQKTGMIGVIKTDAYGHGSVPVAEAIEHYVDGYAVATADEAMLLRRNGIRKMILILGVTHPSRYQELIEEEIRPAIFTMEQAKPLSEMAVRLHKTAKVHLALDTGMRRIGMEADEAGADLAAAIGRLPGIELEAYLPIFPEPMKKRRPLQKSSWSGTCILRTC
ncbi:alanine racemase [Clostridium sp. OF09-36]|uniref:alanine racemase n=1 Tax=Clostridium sp. OF09-36 TaxID=2292310 RepID=UPI00325B479E